MGVILYPYQNFRWDADFIALQALLRLPPSHPNSLGTVWEFESHLDRYYTEPTGTWKDKPLPANGLTYHLGPHAIDQALVLFGRPQRISARIENLRGIGNKEVDDNVCFYFLDVSVQMLMNRANVVYDNATLSSAHPCRGAYSPNIAHRNHPWLTVVRQVATVPVCRPRYYGHIYQVRGRRAARPAPYARGPFGD